MAKVRFKGPIGGLSGSMDGMVFADNGEQTVAYIRKERKGEKSEAELRRDANWAEARAYASSVKDGNAEPWALYKQVGRERKISPFASMKGLGMSLMPEGLEATISIEEMPDLIAYLLTPPKA